MPTETGDFIEIFLLFLLLYLVLKFMQGTIAGTFVRGVGFLLMLAVVSAMLALSSFGLEIIGAIFKYLLGVSVIALLVIFQPELRTALTHLGRNRGLAFFSPPDEIPAGAEMLKAVERLSRRGLGALIVIERQIGLGRWINSGTKINADISSLMLESIFTVPGPLHDGAVIISQDKIAAAGCILPNSERTELGYVLGTRHRAAIGLTEISDAMVIVVSEETRAISLAYGGDIVRGLSITDLSAELNRILAKAAVPPQTESKPKPKHERRDEVYF